MATESAVRINSSNSAEEGSFVKILSIDLTDEESAPAQFFAVQMAFWVFLFTSEAEPELLRRDSKSAFSKSCGSAPGADSSWAIVEEIRRMRSK